LSELDRPDEATRAITRAVELIDSDPFLLPHEYWVRSTVRRRIAMRFGLSAARQREELRGAPTDERLRAQYLDNLMKAFQSVYVAFESKDDPDQDHLPTLKLPDGCNMPDRYFSERLRLAEMAIERLE
jgi:hypothetical protein